MTKCTIKKNDDIARERRCCNILRFNRYCQKHAVGNGSFLFITEAGHTKAFIATTGKSTGEAKLRRKTFAASWNRKFMGLCFFTSTIIFKCRKLLQFLIQRYDACHKAAYTGRKFPGNTFSSAKPSTLKFFNHPGELHVFVRNFIFVMCH